MHVQLCSLAAAAVINIPKWPLGPQENAAAKAALAHFLESICAFSAMRKEETE
jgi:hypothetical protein